MEVPPLAIAGLVEVVLPEALEEPAQVDLYNVPELYDDLKLYDDLEPDG